ncbi:50S ribosomal protein L30 [archaeon]|jgi:ribosomal protein L30E|nr:50S ribosomal protein L30 [archaeon]MBT6824272.1 50S ribosomal protein L30 [archaeon]MBT7107350.1 50S ribosomal protein L30 [archaeon]MBT7297316.1 50S ribosomal protein L30 [archaeon]
MSLANLRPALEEKKVVFGTERALKALKSEKVEELFISKNCPIDLKERLIKYAKIKEVLVTELKESNDELGALCKKPFSVNVCYII